MASEQISLRSRLQRAVSKIIGQAGIFEKLGLSRHDICLVDDQLLVIQVVCEKSPRRF